MNNRKCYYITVTKPNALITKFLSKRDGDFVWIASVIFKQMKNLISIKSHVKLRITFHEKNLQSLKQYIIRKLIKSNILRYLLWSKSMQPLFIAAYHLETMIVEIDDQSKHEELGK